MFYHYLFREEGNIMEVKQMESKQTKASQTIQLHCLENRVASGYVTFGSYWEKGTLSIPNFKNDGMDSFILQNENKESIPVQSRITAWWPDGSIKWAAHTADASKMGQEVSLTAQIKSAATITAQAAHNRQFHTCSFPDSGTSQNCS